MDHRAFQSAGTTCQLRSLRTTIRDERGSVLAFATFALFVILGMVALSVDLGMMYNAETEAQRAADSGALAGAAVWLNSSGDVSATKDEAIQFAEEHRVQGGQVSVSQSDVTVDQANDRVTVVVSHEIDMIFAGLFGFGTVTLNVDATAEAFPAGGAQCPLPIAVVDRWDDSDGDGVYDAGEQYRSCPGPACTGYQDPGDRGQILEIKTSPGTSQGGGSGGKGGDGDQGGGGSTNVISTCEQVTAPGWYCWYRNDHPSQGGGGGAQALRQRVRGCVDPPDPTLVGQTIWGASGSGNKQAVVMDVKQFIDNNDSGASWNPTAKCVTRPGLGGECADGSPRIRLVPLIDPSTVADAGANTKATTSQMARVFLEKVASDWSQPHGGGPAGQWNVYVRFIGGAGSGAIAGGGDDSNSLSQVIRLVE